MTLQLLLTYFTVPPVTVVSLAANSPIAAPKIVQALVFTIALRANIESVYFATGCIIQTGDKPARAALNYTMEYYKAVSQQISV